MVKAAVSEAALLGVGVGESVGTSPKSSQASEVTQQTPPQPRKTNPERTHRNTNTPTPPGLEDQRQGGFPALPVLPDLAETESCPLEFTTVPPGLRTPSPQPSPSTEGSWAACTCGSSPQSTSCSHYPESQLSSLKKSGMFTVTCQEKYRVARAGGVPRHRSATCGSSGAPQVALGGPAGPRLVTLLSAANCSQKRSCDIVGVRGAEQWPPCPPGSTAGERQPHDHGGQRLSGSESAAPTDLADPICMRVSHRLPTSPKAGLGFRK